MNKNKEKILNFFQIAVSLISVHYGLGFLFGSSESVYNFGLSGIIYPLSCAFGLIFLSLISKYYWKKNDPIWKILGDKFGKNIEKSVSLLSCLWMVGVSASQIMGCAYILKILGIPEIFGMIFSIILISFISQKSLSKLSNIFLFFLISNSLVLLFSVFKLSNFIIIKETIFETFPAILSNNTNNTFGIMIPTILITVLGMDFHQFIVKGKNYYSSIFGSIFAGLFLIILSFFPSLIVRSAVLQNILPTNIDGKEIIPFIMLYLGKSMNLGFVGYVLIFSLLAIAIGSGSGITRIIVTTLTESEFLPLKFRRVKIITLLNAVFVLFLALTGKSIVSLIVSFYIIYLSGVLIPFLALLISEKLNISFENKSIFLSLLAGVFSSLLFLVLCRINILPKEINENFEICMLLLGNYISLTTLIFSNIFYYLSSRATRFAREARRESRVGSRKGFLRLSRNDNKNN